MIIDTSEFAVIKERADSADALYAQQLGALTSIAAAVDFGRDLERREPQSPVDRFIATARDLCGQLRQVMAENRAVHRLLLEQPGSEHAVREVASVGRRLGRLVKGVTALAATAACMEPAGTHAARGRHAAPRRQRPGYLRLVSGGAR